MFSPKIQSIKAARSSSRAASEQQSARRLLAKDKGQGLGEQQAEVGAQGQGHGGSREGGRAARAQEGGEPGRQHSPKPARLSGRTVQTSPRHRSRSESLGQPAARRLHPDRAQTPKPPNSSAIWQERLSFRKQGVKRRPWRPPQRDTPLCLLHGVTPQAVAQARAYLQRVQLGIENDEDGKGPNEMGSEWEGARESSTDDTARSHAERCAQWEACKYTVKGAPSLPRFQEQSSKCV